MKNFSNLFFTIALILGISVQGFGQSSKNILQLGNVLLQVKGFDFSLLVTISIVIIIVVVVSVFSSSNKKVLSDSNRQVGIPSVGDWLGRFLTTIIPVVGLIALIVWAVDDKDKIRKNWAVAFIIFAIILMVFSYFLGGLLLAFLMERMGRS